MRSAPLFVLLLSACRILGVDGSVPCASDDDCADARCVDGLCSDAGEGEGEEGEGEGEEGEGEGEAPADVVLVGFGDSGFDRADLDVLFVGANDALGDNDALAVVKGCADACDVQPVVDDVAAIGLAGRAVSQETTARLENLGNVVETVFRAPTDGSFATVLVARDGNDGWQAIVDSDELRVSGGDAGCRFEVQPGAWHHLLCAGRNGPGGVRCALDGADAVCDESGELVSVGTLRPVALTAGSSSDVSDGAVAVVRAWNADLSEGALLTSGNLGRLLQRRLFAGLGLIGPAPRQESTTSIVGPPRLVLPAPDRLTLVGAEWPRVVADGVDRAALFEPRTTNLLALDAVNCDRVVDNGVEGCDVADDGTLELELPAGGSSLSFFAGDVDVDVVVPGLLTPLGDEPLACARVAGFVSCAVDEDTVNVSVRPTAATVVTALQLEAGPSTTSAGPATGDTRAADRLDAVVSGGRQTVTLRLRRTGGADATIGTLKVINENAGDACAPAGSFGVDCNANEVCDVDGRCHGFTGNNVVKIQNDVVKIGATAVGGDVGTGVLTLIVRGPASTATCDGVASPCRVLNVSGRPGRLELGDPSATRNGSDAGFVVVGAVASP